MAGAAAIGQRDYEKAIAHLERAIELDPDAYWPAGMVVQAYEALGESKAAAAANRRALARCEKILADEPDHSGALGFLVTALAPAWATPSARANGPSGHFCSIPTTRGCTITSPAPWRRSRTPTRPST